MENPSTVYHERQRKQLCALHVLNNLFQKKDTFTQTELDDICTSLTPSRFMNPHRSVLGLGNYDVNVITAALQTRDLCLVWFDRRKNVEKIDFSKVKGVILNVPSDYKIGFIKIPFDFKHWYVIRELEGSFYNLDSKLDKPERLGDRQTVVDFLKQRLTLDKTQLLLVVEPAVENMGSWYMGDTEQ
ncbi:josephin-2-like [Mercenaria mercenaria]|uniref:josephin-2-like n=1 Tax=Mercenaria mercenaria TaxID=6596 RepID=UPI00234F155C|nr:josephin-2-like [Mercenaria mercenaria]